MKRIAEDIRSRQFKRIYLIFGNEPYLVRETRQRLFQAAVGEDQMNNRVLVNSEISLDELRDFTDTVPFFAEKRVLLLDECGIFRNTDPNLISWAESLPETALVIISEREADKRTKLFKTIQKIGYVAELNHPEGKERNDWILKQIGQRKINITRTAFELLLESLPESMESSRLEIGKLCDYVGDGNAIRPEDVEAVVTPKLENRVFKLVDAAVNGRREETFALYYELVALRESPLRIMSLIGKELMKRLMISRMNVEGLSPAEISASTGTPDFVVKRILKERSRLSDEELAQAAEQALNDEQDVKSGDLGETAAVELLLFSLTGSL